MKQSSYQLLKDVQTTINRLEDKFDKRVGNLEEKVNINEGKLDTLAGKIGIVVMFVTLFVTGIVSFVFDFIKNKF